MYYKISEPTNVLCPFFVSFLSQSVVNRHIVTHPHGEQNEANHIVVLDVLHSCSALLCPVWSRLLVCCLRLSGFCVRYINSRVSQLFLVTYWLFFEASHCIPPERHSFKIQHAETDPILWSAIAPFMWRPLLVMKNSQHCSPKRIYSHCNRWCSSRRFTCCKILAMWFRNKASSWFVREHCGWGSTFHVLRSRFVR